MIPKNEAIELLNDLGSKQKPFKFYCDFLGEEWEIQSTHLESQAIFHLEISSDETKPAPSHTFEKSPVALKDYQQAFNYVVHQIKIGNSFLTNLTFKTPISTNLSLKQIFEHCSAKYRLLVPSKLVVFSPETFIKIKGSEIFSYPMKGTIDADISDAEVKILEDPKETAEHVTIVDLIRNDLSRVAKNVEVTRFRYLGKLITNQKKLLQVSSEIKGMLASNWRSNIGSILSKLIPAGSISGAPKPETINIIQKSESYEREFYTGICGEFDGENFDSAVMIRFIKKENDQLYYCSGGGITSFSELEKEYQEMIDKIYLPIDSH